MVILNKQQLMHVNELVLDECLKLRREIHTNIDIHMPQEQRRLDMDIAILQAIKMAFDSTDEFVLMTKTEYERLLNA